MMKYMIGRNNLIDLRKLSLLKVSRSTRLSIHTENISTDIDQKLRDDIKQIGKTLGMSINSYDPKVLENVEALRKLGRQWRAEGNSTATFDQMVNKVKSCDSKMLYGISRSFANFLALANTAENHHRIRKLKNSLVRTKSEFGLWPKSDSCSGSIEELIKNEKISAVEILEALKTQKVEIVLTAHPTEVNRRTMLQKLRRIGHILEQTDRPAISIYERKQLQNQLQAEISSIWGSDFLRRTKPSPVSEAKSGLVIVETVLWNAIPNFLRKLDDVAKVKLNQSLPLNIAPIKIGSWMGGDRDGNPNVTPEVTLEVSMLSRWMAATLFKSDIISLRTLLSMDQCSDELKAVTTSRREPYREVLRNLESRLQSTVEWAESYIQVDNKITRYADSKSFPPLKETKELMEPLLMLHRSLVETGLSEVADGPLVDTIRRVAVFGLSLMPLDIRQESTRHTEALDAITRYLGVGSYSRWNEDSRRNWLQAELSSKRPLLPKGLVLEKHPTIFTPTVIDTLRTFDTIAALYPDSLSAYVISQCQQASDVLAVMLLQRDAGVETLLRVVPLFETLDDLERSAATVEALFSMSIYRGQIAGKQEIMVGYSDSAKDAGRLAASWAQYNAQVAMIEVANEYDIELTFFHGKGGTVGRGGNPAVFEAILAHPPATVNSRFRVTEQGEMITQNLGQEAVAERTLDLFTAGVLVEKFIKRSPVKNEWKQMMERLSVISCESYRSVVRGEPRFVPYFRTATPELELSGLNVGSRPAKRNPKGGVESLRAIPWVFAWTQTRLNLPTWLGVGDALAQEFKTNPKLLKEMYNEWPWFRTLIDLLEMILVKSDAIIAANYDKQLVTDPESLALGEELRAKMVQTIEAVLAVSGNESLQCHNKLLISSLAVRNPYIDPLNIIQVELLRRLRSDESIPDEELRYLQDALLITINGIANGMRNSG